MHLLQNNDLVEAGDYCWGLGQNADHEELPKFKISTALFHRLTVNEIQMLYGHKLTGYNFYTNRKVVFRLLDSQEILIDGDHCSMNLEGSRPNRESPRPITHLFGDTVEQAQRKHPGYDFFRRVELPSIEPIFDKPIGILNMWNK